LKRTVPSVAAFGTTGKGQSIDCRGQKRKLLETRYVGRWPRDPGWSPDTPHDSLLCLTPLLQESCVTSRFSLPVHQSFCSISLRDFEDDGLHIPQMSLPRVQPRLSSKRGFAPGTKT
jgi:hypothetical protein